MDVLVFQGHCRALIPPLLIEGVGLLTELVGVPALPAEEGV